MKKIVSTFLLGSMLAIVPAMPAPAEAAVPFTPDFDEFELAELYDHAPEAEFAVAAIKPCPAGTFKVRRNTRTKKKLVNSLIAGGIGAAVGGGIGGGRGALIGLGSGAGGYLVYRYVRDRRGRCVPRYVRRG